MKTITFKREFKNSGRSCSVAGCGKPSRTRGLCPKHYSRFRRKGSPVRLPNEERKPRRLNIFLEPGQRFARFVFIKEVQRRNGIRFGLFKCDCGNEVESNIYSVRYGQSQSCGCYVKDVNKAMRTKHGLTNTPEYAAWLAMRARCYRPTTENYARYGGRGITVCDRWLSSFEIFLFDMGRRPTPHHSLDRIDNDGNYGPNNCRWATHDEQQQNRSVTLFLTIGGEKKAIKHWSDISGISYGRIYSRIQEGWEARRAVFEPVEIQGSNQRRSES